MNVIAAEAPTTTARLGDVLDAFPAAKMRKYGASIVAAVSALASTVVPRRPSICTCSNA